MRKIFLLDFRTKKDVFQNKTKKRRSIFGLTFRSFFLDKTCRKIYLESTKSTAATRRFFEKKLGFSRKFVKVTGKFI